MLDGMMVANTDIPATNLEVGLTPGLPTLVLTELPCEAILEVTLSVRDNEQLKELQICQAGSSLSTVRSWYRVMQNAPR